MKRVNRIILIISLILYVITGCIYAIDEQIDPYNNKKTIVVIGSSVAAGWVTSHEKKNDLKNGWAYRLERMLKPDNITVINESKPGETTAGVLKRISKDVISKNPDFAIIALSLSNEGIEGDHSEKVMKQFYTNMKEIVNICKNNRIVPIIGSCYACDDYELQHYEYTKKMNLMLHTLGIPMINFLGVLDDGIGHFPKGSTYDFSHPNNIGHEEMFYAVVPGIFTVNLVPMKKIDDNPEKYVSVKNGNGANAISFIPKEPIHSFTSSFKVKTKATGKLLNIKCFSGDVSLSVSNGKLFYSDGNGTVQKLRKSFNKNEWNTITISHGYLQNETTIFLGDEEILEINEQLLPLHFVLGAKIEKADFRDLLVYRGALNQDEIKYLNAGNLYSASLEVYAPLQKKVKKNHPLKNYANSNSDVIYFHENEKIDILNLKTRIIEHKKRNAKKFPEKKAVEVPLSTLKKYTGKYKVGENDTLEVLIKNGQLSVLDRGIETKIFPESETRFFVKYPLAEIRVIFESGNSEEKISFQMTVNGKIILKGSKI